MLWLALALAAPPQVDVRVGVPVVSVGPMIPMAADTRRETSLRLGSNLRFGGPRLSLGVGAELDAWAAIFRYDGWPEYDNGRRQLTADLYGTLRWTGTRPVSGLLEIQGGAALSYMNPYYNGVFPMVAVGFGAVRRTSAGAFAVLLQPRIGGGDVSYVTPMCSGLGPCDAVTVSTGHHSVRAVVTWTPATG